MSRAVQEDLSGLTFSERSAKRWKCFKTWLYNSEEGTIMGDRQAKEWGILLLYYLVFYMLLAAFTAIFFALLGFMLPIRPNEETRGICSKRPNARDACGTGPYFQAIDLSAVAAPEDEIYTDEIFKFGLCEPALVAIPRALSFNGAEPSIGFNTDETNRKGYKLFVDEVNRVFCQGEFNTGFNPDCDQSTQVNQRILPLVPLAPPVVPNENSTEPAKLFLSPDDFVNISPKLSEPDYKFARPLYSFGEGGAYETYMVFLRFNKVWNYQPYHVLETDGVSEVPIEHSIGVACEFSDPCTEGKAKNYRNEDVDCDGTRTASSGNNIKLDVLSNVMTNYDKFPWRGGVLNMNFGSVAVTYMKGTSIPEELQIICTMGINVEEGRSSVAADGSPVSASSRYIANLNKQASGRAYSTGSRQVFISLNS